MSATVTGTVLTVLGWKKRPLEAKATTTSATAASAAAKASFTGRDAGLKIGIRKPNAGRALGARATPSNARAISTFASGTASRLAIDLASSEMLLNRASHSEQASRWAASAPDRAS